MKLLTGLIAGIALGAICVMAMNEQERRRRLCQQPPVPEPKPEVGGRLAGYWNIPYSRN